MAVVFRISHSQSSECFKGDKASQWKRPEFDSSPRQNPLTNLDKIWHGWQSRWRHSAS